MRNHGVGFRGVTPAQTAPSLLFKRFESFLTHHVGIGPHFSARREKRHEEPVKLHEMRPRRFASTNGDEPFFNPQATERRRDDEHPANGVGGRESCAYRLANCSDVAPDNALNSGLHIVVNVCGSPPWKLRIYRVSCKIYSAQVLDRLAYSDMQS